MECQERGYVQEVGKHLCGIHYIPDQCASVPVCQCVSVQVCQCVSKTLMCEGAQAGMHAYESKIRVYTTVQPKQGNYINGACHHHVSGLFLLSRGPSHAHPFAPIRPCFHTPAPMATHVSCAPMLSRTL